MKLRVTLPAVLAAAVVAVFAPLFSACDDRVFHEPVDLALAYARVGELAVTAIPAPIEKEDWDNEEYEPANSDSGGIVVKNWDKEDVVIVARANKEGTVITWGQSKGGRPARFNNLSMPAILESDDLFFFRLENPETNEVKYYRFIPLNARGGKELFAITVAGREGNKIPTAVSTMEELALRIQNDTYRGTIDITVKESLEALIAATPQDETARIRYAIAANITAAGNGEFGEFKDPLAEEEENDKNIEEDKSKPKVVVVQDEQGKNITQTHATLVFTDGNILAVEVTAQNDDCNYFAFQVTTGALATIAKLTIGGKEVAGKGSPAYMWANVVPGSFSSADQPSGGFKINVQLEDPDGTYEWVRRGRTQGEPASSVFSSEPNPTVKFTHEEYLVLKVHSPRARSTDNRYYRVQINLLAANFKRHPQSAAYTITKHNYPTADVTVLIDDAPVVQHRILIDAYQKAVGADGVNPPGRTISPPTVAPLSFQLDRTGSFTYQWYTANSWYGGYGFDCLGNIENDPGVLDDNHGTSGHEYNHSFNDDHKDYYPNPAALDEKGNISFHNGGNQYYRLPNPGMKIDGATQPTYTPTVDSRNRPFITGFSNQTQYYWVVVTDETGLKATSDRAAIVTEWGKEFNRGVEGEAVTKKHHIVDTHAYMSGGAGLRDNPRNATPFKAGNHGDQYLIPITFPSGFNVKEYKVVTCQALFFLADGRPWIQNWTQGDFGFADANGDRLVLWYNVTNDNATRGLDGTGNEPSGGGLDVTPAYLIVQPAGTKPIKNMPPFAGKDNYGRDKPQPNNDAQGWFTPYIEIVELRFEGPRR